MPLIALMIGSFAGAVLRYTVGDWIASRSFVYAYHFPLGTLVINLLGCFVLGWFLTIISDRWKVSESVRLGLGTGLLGSFTTFSTFSVETLELAGGGKWPEAVLYVTVSVLGGMLLSACGWYLARIQTNRHKQKEAE